MTRPRPHTRSMPEPVTVRRALAQAGLAPIDAQVLLALVLRRDRAWLVAHATDALARADAERSRARHAGAATASRSPTLPAGASSGACR